MTQMASEIEGAADEIGIEMSDLTCPDGTAGFALFPSMNEDTGLPGPGMLLVNDLGESFEQGQQLIETLVEKAGDEGATVERIELAGRTVHVVTAPQMDEEMDEDMDGDMDDDWDDFGGMEGFGPDPEAMLAESMSTSHIAFDGTRLFVTSSLDALQGAFDAIDGKGQSSIDGRRDYQALSNKLGDSDAWVMLLTRDIDSMMASLDPMGMSMMVKPMATQMVGSLGGVGMGLRFSGDRAMAEQTLAFYMPTGTAGLTDLLNQPAPRGELPSFVGADVVSYTHVNFEFGGIADAIQPVLAMAPMLMGGMDPNGGPPPDIAGMIDQVTSCLGNEMHMMQTLTRPIAADSLKQVMAIECTNPQQLSAMVGELGMAIGLAPRDFMGHQIFGMDPQMAAAMAQQLGGPSVEPPALGFSGNQLFIGPTAAVEAALRATGDRDGAGAAGNEVFQRCDDLLTSDDVVAWGFADTTQMLEAQQIMMNAQMEELGQFMDPAEIEMAMGPALMMMELLTPEFMSRYLGPTAWEMTAQADGLTMKMFQLAPASE